MGYSECGDVLPPEYAPGVSLESVRPPCEAPIGAMTCPYTTSAPLQHQRLLSAGGNSRAQSLLAIPSKPC